VVSAIVGAAGLLPTLSAIRAGKDIALANKESLVIAGPLVMSEAKKYGVKLLPIDSEHSAVYQSLKGHRSSDIKNIILTASGGPFLKRSIKSFGSITPAEALKHPTWTMGRRITIDSATLMNKGFEVIEARWLFGLKGEKIKVTIHPESIVHSMVEYVDGSIISQLGNSDMKGPISYALGHPKRLSRVGMDPFTINGKTLHFSEPSLKRFPCLGLAYRALELGESAPAVLNAADEVAVDIFLKGKIPFTGIHETLEAVLEGHDVEALKSVDDVLDADRLARAAARAHIRKYFKV
ncbi:MAG: 1-deoxy-D-xylulose-5-phosphate reductoisomerase, partial [Deltaproteobacteria bacterium]|nr:1-deoxy-D-xylulose-5-phosphate reductoisomerase [Deltaproteobacteria bacterium]